MRALRYLSAALALAGAVVTGCGSSGGGGADASDVMTVSDSPHNTDGKADAKTDGKGGHEAGTGDTGTHHDGSTGDTGMMAETGTDGGPCDFAAFVLGLIKNDTTAMATPSTNLGQSCTDKMDQTQFASLFP